MHLLAKECQVLPATTRTQERGVGQVCSYSPQGALPMLDFGLLVFRFVRKQISAVFKLSSLQYFVTAALGHENARFIDYDSSRVILLCEILLCVFVEQRNRLQYCILTLRVLTARKRRWRHKTRTVRRTAVCWVGIKGICMNSPTCFLALSTGKSRKQ